MVARPVSAIRGMLLPSHRPSPRALLPVDRGAEMATRRFSELWVACQQDMRTLRGSPSTTIDTYNVTAQQFVAFLKSTDSKLDDVRRFTAVTVQAFVVALAEAGGHPNTILRDLAALRTIARYGLRWPTLQDPVMSTDPTLAVARPRYRRATKQMPTPAELRAFLAVPVDDETRLTRDLMLDTGLRSSELARLTLGHLRELPDGVSLACTTKGRPDVEAQNPVSPEVVAQIHAALERRQQAGLYPAGGPTGDEPLLIRNRAGRGHDKVSLWTLITGIARRAGITRFPLGPHSLRHLAANLGKGQMADTTRSRLLNHSSPATIQHYDHAMPGELREGRQAQRRAFLVYLAPVGGETPRVEPSVTPEALLARLAEALVRLPAAQIEAFLKLAEAAAGPVQSGDGISPERPNAEATATAPEASVDAPLGDVTG